MDALLRAFLRADFDWTTHIEAIWQPPGADIAELQAEARADLELHVEDLAESDSPRSPLGVPLLGMAGAGKTHLLSVLCQRAFAQKMFFVLADMTDVSDFWETVLLGYLRSLQQASYEPEQRQVDVWLSTVAARYGETGVEGHKIPSQRPPGLINTCNALVAAVTKQHPNEGREHADVLRALVLFACDHSEINDLGYKWLQGIGIDEDERRYHDFREIRCSPQRIVKGLSWLLSIHGPTVLALDQLDAIVAEHNLASGTDPAEPDAQQQKSLAIIQGISGGLMALRDVTRRTLSVVSALNVTWDILKERSTVSMTDRYHEPLRLDENPLGGSLRNLVARRLERAYEKAEVAPEYPTYPFTDSFFQKHRSNTPRELLKACDAHRRACRKAGVVFETTKVVTPAPASPDRQKKVLEELDATFERLQGQADLEEIFADRTESGFDNLIETACRALLREQSLPSAVIAQVDTDFLGTGNYDPLHARVRLILTHQNERERHHAFRFLQQDHYRAFQARLKAAITASGIDHALGFRRLTILRRGAPPGSAKTKSLLDELARQGGQLLEPGHDELRKLDALSRLMDGPDEPNDLDEWLQDRKPVSSLPSFGRPVQWLFKNLGVGESSPESNATPPSISDSKPLPASDTKARGDGAPTNRATPTERGGPLPQTGKNATLPIGRTSDGEVGIDASTLTNHTCVLAGSGSGKTVFLRRIIEEAALLGVPSIVLDGANDLSRLGDAWPSRPDAFNDDDAAKAERYHQMAEVVVWTPGLRTGNPLVLNPIPEFSKVDEWTDEAKEQFAAAVQMGVASLEPLAAPGNSAKSKKGRAILTSALERFGERGGGSLRELIELLREPPDEVIEGYAGGDKLAQEISELLLSAMKTDPLLGEDGASLDPSRLFRAHSPDRVRVSVINLAGLQGLEAQRQFVNQLAMTLFSYLKKNPAPAGQIAGLLVIDEAKDFIPSTQSVPGKDNLIRLVAQARKYGLGMLFATQAPKSIDHQVVANCSTLLVGKANSPTAIDTVQRLLQDKGGGATAGRDVGKLSTGTFYASTSRDPKPKKITTSLCLSYHPSSPPPESEVRERARRSREVVG